MKNVNNQLEHLHLWQSRNYSNASESDTNPSRLAELHRNNIAQLTAAICCKDVDVELAKFVIDEQYQTYSSIVDGSDTSRGLNNCADAALSLARGFHNRSELWKSGLTYDSVKTLECVRDLVNESTSADKGFQDELKILKDKKLVQLPVPSLKSHYSSSSCKTFESIPFANVAESVEKYKNVSEISPASFGSWTRNDVNDSKKRKKLDLRENDDEDTPKQKYAFKSAKEQLALNQRKKFQSDSPQDKMSTSSGKKSLGSRPRNQCFSKFIPPANKDKEEGYSPMNISNSGHKSVKPCDDDIDPKLKGIDPQLIELVLSEIMDRGPPITWSDIAGLEFAKSTIKEIVIWPMLRPDIFTGLRGPPKGILLFGPPGTGKTLIGKCIANQSGATFFSISASSLTSKWIGQAEKMVRALFAVASLHQPAVIFIDEIDSLLSQRSDTEHESSRRIKTEFFVQLDGATTSSEDRILVVGATNRPQEIDEAARRRLVKRLYIPLPDDGARQQIIEKLMKQQPSAMSREEILTIVQRTDGYSGADVTNLCKDAALGPIRSLQATDITRISKEDVRPITYQDFEKSLLRVRASVSAKDLTLYEEWNKTYGCGTL